MPVTTYELVAVKRTVSPASRVNGTVNGTAVDLQALRNCQSGIAVLITGAVTDGTHTLGLEESDTSAGSYSAIPASRLSGALPAATSANPNAEFEVGFIAQKQFVRGVVVTTGATTGGFTSVVIVAGEPDYYPPR